MTIKVCPTLHVFLQLDTHHQIKFSVITSKSFFFGGVGYNSTLVEGDPKVHFSIATTQRHGGWRYFIPRIAPTLPWILTL